MNSHANYARALLAGVVLGLTACTTQGSNTVIGSGPLPLVEPSTTEIDAEKAGCPATISIVDSSTKAIPLNELDEDLVRLAAEQVLADLGPEIVRDEQGIESEMHIDIKRAYVHGLATSKSAVVVLSVSSKDSQESTFYRGRSVGVNWAGSSGEFTNSIRRAMREALKPLTYQLSRNCAA